MGPVGRNNRGRLAPLGEWSQLPPVDSGSTAKGHSGSIAEGDSGSVAEGDSGSVAKGDSGSVAKGDSSSVDIQSPVVSSARPAAENPANGDISSTLVSACIVLIRTPSAPWRSEHPRCRYRPS